MAPMHPIHVEKPMALEHGGKEVEGGKNKKNGPIKRLPSTKFEKKVEGEAQGSGERKRSRSEVVDMELDMTKKPRVIEEREDEEQHLKMKAGLADRSCGQK